MKKADRELVSTKTQADLRPQKAPGLSTKWRLVISIALLFHLAVQFYATTTTVPPESPLSFEFKKNLGFYIVAANLNQGYRFFAPDPGPSHIIRYEVFDKDGKPKLLDADGEIVGQLPPTELRVGLFSPRPRLLYHRYFMLTEQVLPYCPDPNSPPDERNKNEIKFKIMMDSFAQEILRRNDAEKVRIQYIRHEFPSPSDVERGIIDLSNSASYHTLWSGEFQRNKSADSENAAPKS